jgi:poly-gamma-glutamate synthesis protein (capsule biosynthesis protein)
VFNAPAELVDALKWAGFDLLSFANNHVYDQRVAGFKETLEQLEARGFTPLGAGRTCEEASAPHIVDVNGISVAMVGSSRLHNEYYEPVEGEHCSFRITATEDLLPSVKKAQDAGADLIMISMHHGTEYKTTPNTTEVKMVHALVDAGVDVFVGHHAHVLQPIEKITTESGNTGFAIWSLGNFLTNQSAWYVHGRSKLKDGYPRDSGIVTLKVVQRGEDGGPSETAVEAVQMEPVWVKYDRTRKPSRMHPVLIRDTIAAIDHAIMTELDPKAVPLLQTRRKLYTDRLAQIQKVVGKEWVMTPHLPEEVQAEPDMPQPPETPAPSAESPPETLPGGPDQ